MMMEMAVLHADAGLSSLDPSVKTQVSSHALYLWVDLMYTSCFMRLINP